MQKYIVLFCFSLLAAVPVLAQAAGELEFVTCQIERTSETQLDLPEYARQFVMNLPDSEGMGDNYEKAVHLSSRAVVMDFTFSAKGIFKLKIQERGTLLQKKVKIDLKKLRKVKQFKVEAEKEKLKYSIECKL